jgi:hypothetical protein
MESSWNVEKTVLADLKLGKPILRPVWERRFPVDYEDSSDGQASA